MLSIENSHLLKKKSSSFSLAFFKFQSTTGKLASRETRVGWLLLTVQTEANGDSWSTYEKGSFAGSFGLVVVALPWLLWSAQYKILFTSPHTFSL
jgi:hypothetical protein